MAACPNCGNTNDFRLISLQIVQAAFELNESGEIEFTGLTEYAGMEPSEFHYGIECNECDWTLPYRIGNEIFTLDRPAFELMRDHYPSAAFANGWDEEDTEGDK